MSAPTRTLAQRRSAAARKAAMARAALAALNPQLPTYTQRMVLNVIRGRIAEHGMAPTLKEIAQALGYASHSGPARIVYALEHKGYLTRRRRGWQAIELAQNVPKLSRSRVTPSLGLLSEAA